MLPEASRTVRDRLPLIPDTALILGSGLGIIADDLDDIISIPYSEIPGFPLSTAPGHKSRLVYGRFDDVPALFFQGRLHHYEGYTPDQITYPIALLSELGCKKLILTNASGGVNRSYRPGDLMVIKDHINFVGVNPLRGPRFNDMGKAYSITLREQIEKAASRSGIKLKTGVYGWTMGPSFETASEIKMMRICGADAVGMSTVPEVVAAVDAGLSVAAISCISNMACGMLDQPITSEEVIETGLKVRKIFIRLIREFLKETTEV